MVDVQKVEKTAESGGIKNVAPPQADPASPTFITPNTAIEQASATVPGSEAAAEQAFPSDSTVKELQKVAPTGKTFSQVRAEREQAEKEGYSLEPNPPYGNPNNATGVVAKPSKKTQAETDRGKKAQSEAGGFPEKTYSSAQVASRHVEEVDRNKAADEQMAKVTEELAKEQEVEAKKASKK